MPTFLERIEAEEEAELKRQKQQSPSRPANTTVIPEGIDWHKKAVGAGISPSANGPGAVIPEGIDWHKKAVGAGVSPSANQPKPKKVSIDLSHPAVAWFARAQGAPYYYGGTDKKRGIDCSAAMQQSFATMGVKLPRTADEQFHSTLRVEPDQVRPGDMIFFKGTNSKKPGKITHVGVVAANGVMGNAGTGGVEFESYNTPYWRKRIAGFGRPKGGQRETISERMLQPGAAGLNLPESWREKPAPKKSISVQITTPQAPPKRFSSWVELATPDLKTERKLAEEERRRVQSLAREEERRLLTNTKLDWDANPLTLAKKLYALRKLNNNMQDTPSNALEAKMRSFDIGALQSLHDSALKAGNTELSSAVKGVITQTAPSQVFETMQGLDWRTLPFWKTGILEGGILDVAANQFGNQADTMTTAALLTILGGGVGAATGGVLSKVIPAATAATGVFLSDFKMEDASKYSQVLAEAGAPLHNADALNTWLSDNPEQVEHAKAIAKKRGLAVAKTDAMFTLLGAGVLARAAGKARRLAEAGKAMSRGEKALTAGTVGAIEFASEPAGEGSGLRAEGKSLSEPESIRAMGEEGIYSAGTSATMTGAQIAASGALATPQVAAKVIKGEPLTPNWPPRAFAARPRITEAKPVDGGFRVTVDDIPIPEVIPVASTKEAVNAAREHPVYKLAALTRTVRATPDLGGATVELTDDGALRIRGKGGAEGIVRRATREEAKAAQEANQDSAGISARNAGGKTVGAWYKDGVLTMVDGASIDDVSHEVSHWLRDIGLVTDAEYEAIVRWSAKADPTIGKAIAQLEKQVAQGDPNAARELQLERDEAFAIAVQNYTAAQLAPASIQSILARVRELWTRLTNVDYRAARGVMQDIYSGQTVNRPVPGATPQTATPAAPAAPASPAGGTISPGESEIDRGTMSPPAPEPEPVVTPTVTPDSTPAPEAPAAAPAPTPAPEAPPTPTPAPRPAATPPARPAPTGEPGWQPLPEVVPEMRTMDVNDIHVHPQMQYKSQGIVDPKNKVTAQFKGLNEFNTQAAGVGSVWEALDGTVYAGDFHHRLELAKRAKRWVGDKADGGSGEVPRGKLIVKVYREADGWSLELARGKFALDNIRDGKGTAVDAVRAMKDLKLRRDDMLSRGVSEKSKLYRNIVGLFNLSDDLFGAVANGTVPEDVAAGIGEVTLDPGMQKLFIESAKAVGIKTYDDALAYAEDAQREVVEAKKSPQMELPGGDDAGWQVTSAFADVVAHRTLLLKQLKNAVEAQRREALRPVSVKELENEFIDRARREEIAKAIGETRGAAKDKLDLAYQRNEAFRERLTEAAKRIGRGESTIASEVASLLDPTLDLIQQPIAVIIGRSTEQDTGSVQVGGRTPGGGDGDVQGVHGRPDAAVETDRGLDSEPPVVDTLTGDLFGEAPPADAPAERAAGVDEPWRLTRDEYVARMARGRDYSHVPEGDRQWVADTDKQTDLLYHTTAVQGALSEGKPVPDAVIAEYQALYDDLKARGREPMFERPPAQAGGTISEAPAEIVQGTMSPPPSVPQANTATNARGETVYKHPKTGEEYIISDGISEGRSWGTYTRKPNGNLKRVSSPKVPVRASREEAEADLKRWLGLSAAEPARDAESHTVTPDVTPVTKTPKVGPANAVQAALDGIDVDTVAPLSPGKSPALGKLVAALEGQENALPGLHYLAHAYSQLRDDKTNTGMRKDRLRELLRVGKAELASPELVEAKRKALADPALEHADEAVVRSLLELEDVGTLEDMLADVKAQKEAVDAEVAKSIEEAEAEKSTPRKAPWQMTRGEWAEQMQDTYLAAFEEGINSAARKVLSSVHSTLLRRVLGEGITNTGALRRWWHAENNKYMAYNTEQATRARNKGIPYRTQTLLKQLSTKGAFGETEQAEMLRKDLLAFHRVMADPEVEAKRISGITPEALGELGTGEHAGHRQYVSDAIDEGKPVPAEVLEEYPDLKRRIPPPETEPTPVGKGSVGPKLSKAEREGVWRTLKDVYREHKVQKVEKGQDQHGDPIFGYPHAPEYFVTSDLTGAKLRHYVTLPDGRIAHPTELWADVSKAEVDRRLNAIAAEVQARERVEQSRLARVVNEADLPEGQTWRDAANRKYHATNRKIEGSYFAGDGKGRHVRVDGNSERDVQFWQDQGFTHRESNPVAPEPPEALKPETPDPAADTITPSPEESLELTAQGHEDNEAVQAARRVLEKRRQRQVTEEPPTIHILKPADSGKADAAVTSTSSEWDTQDPRLEALLAKEDDIPLEAAVNAYRWNSMQPEDRGRQARRDYTSHLNFSLLALWDKFTGDDQRAMLEEQWPAIRERFRQNYLTMLGRRGNTASALVTGPANFPTARNKKALAAEAAAERKLYDDFNKAHDRLKSQLRKAGSALEDMLTKYFGASMVEHVGMSGTRDYGKERRDALKSVIRTNIKKIGMVHGAEGRNRARAALRAAQDQTGVALFPPSDRIWGDPTEIPGNTKPPASGEELLARFDGATVMVNFDEDRVQIDFKAKPNETLRAALKGAGWHWSPRNGVWQRKNTENAEVSALNILRRFMTKDESAVPGPNTYEGKVRGKRPALNPPATDENPDIRFAGRRDEQGGLFSYDDLEDHPRRTYALIVRSRSADELAKHGLREIGTKNDVQVVTADGEPLTPEVMAEIGAYESALPDASIPKGQRMINVVPPATTWRHEGGGRWSEYSGGKWQPAKTITPAVVQSWVLDTPRNRKAAEIKFGDKMLNPTNPPDYYGGRTLFAVIGEQGAKEAERKNLEVAKEMKAKGLDHTTIWLATGWQLGKDGKWRAEQGDKTARLIGDGLRLRDVRRDLEDILHFPALYGRYPNLAKVRVVMNSRPHPDAWTGATYLVRPSLPGFPPSERVHETHGIALWPNAFRDQSTAHNIPEGDLKPLERGYRRRTLLHEVQHIIQTIEGFAKYEPGYEQPRADAIDDFESYWKQPGEVEGRIPAWRERMTNDERKATPLSESADVKDVLFDEEPVRFAVIPDDKAPQKTVRAYKLFERGKDGGLYPLKFPDKGKPIPVGVWVEAEVKPKKPGFAHRPGWHAGRLPDAGWLKQRSTGDYDPNRVWAEVELSADVDWQPEADASKSKDIKHDIPRGGMYRFPRPGNQGGEWVIAGTMRINRVLTPDEVQSILADAKGDVRFAARPDDPEPDQKSLFDDVDVVIEEGLKYIGSQNVTRMDWNSFDDGKAVLQGMGELFDDSREAIRRQRRGVQTWSETRALAQAKALGITPKMLARIKPGTAFNAENATALRMAFMHLARKWEDAQRTFAASGTVEDMAARDLALAEWKVAMLAAQGAPTEAGRSLQAYKMMAQEVRRLGSKKDLLYQRLLELRGPVDDALMIQIADIPDNDTVALFRILNKAAKAQAKWGDRVHTVLYCNMLSSLNPHGMNFLGNLSHTLLERAAYAGAAGVDAARSAITGKKREIYFVPALRKAARAKAFYDVAGTLGRALDRGITLAKEGFTVEQAERFDIPHGHSLPSIRINGKDYQNPYEWPLRGLGSADEIQRSIAEQISINDSCVTAAINNLKRQGKRFGVDEIAEEAIRVRDELIEHPEFIEEARKQGDRILLTSPPGDQLLGPFMNMINGEVLNTGLRPLKLVVPFVRVAANSAKRGMEWGPLGTLELINPDLTTKERELVISRAMLGTLAMAGLYTAAMAGALDIQGEEPEDTGERSLQNGSGRGAWSIRRPGTNRWVPLYVSGVLTPMLYGVVSAVDATKAGKSDEEVQTAFWGGVRGIYKGVMDQKYMQGLTTVLNALADSGGRWQNYVDSAVGNVMGQFVPMGGLVGQVANATDKVKRDTRRWGDDKSLLGPAVSRVKSRIPGFRQTLPPALDVLGREMPQNPTGIAAFSKLVGTSERPDPVQDELLRLGWAPGYVGKEFSRDKVTYKLTRQQWLDYQKQAGTLAYSRLTSLFESDRYREASEEQKLEMARRLVSDTRARVRGQIKRKVMTAQ